MLTVKQIENAQPKDKEYCLADDNGLYLRVLPSGSKNWILRLYAKGKNTRKGLGSYPDISPREARRRAAQIKYMIDPVADKTILTFEDIARDWLKSDIYGKKAPYYIKNIELRMNKYVLPYFADTLVSEITGYMVVDCCKKIIELGHIEVAKRVRIIIRQVLSHAKFMGVVTSNAADDTASKIMPAGHKEKHHPVLIGNEAIGQFMRLAKAYPFRVVRDALIFSMQTYCRPGEIRLAEWSEIDFEKATWTIPAEKTKQKSPHTVYLSKQSIALLSELKKIQLSDLYVFPSARDKSRGLSPDTVRMAIRSLGYTQEQLVPHSVRGTASTALNEYGFNPDIIEASLGHTETNKVRGAYNHATYDKLRQVLAQWWCDYLDCAEKGKKPPKKPKVTITL